ncbi:MAG: inositol monophosphatase family protein [Anaerolineae bacterium]|nr:inositol monophosphatase [Candidatus Roseilinea sp.]MDW8451817.1 inositol monophosphatase family protein [Anaerolineae bacterium]
MELDQLWEDIFSEDAERVRSAWAGLNAQERISVRRLLERITGDAQRIEAQRAAARFALTALEIRYVAGAPECDLPEDALDFARNLAHDTGRRLKATFGRLTAALKRDGTLVTQSDIESDRRLSDAILARYPTHGILSEERDKIFRGQEWCWVIDPIDGTTNFTWGLPAWGVLIGLLHFGQPVLGVADFPMTDEQYYAVRGSGAWLNETPIHVATVNQDERTGEPIVQKTQLFACCTRTLRHGQPDIPMKLRIVGTTGYNLALVAKGACLGSLDMTSHVWDVAAVWTLIEEAGGCVRTNLQRELFPLQVGQDYGSLAFSILAACSPPMMAYLERRLGDRFFI